MNRRFLINIDIFDAEKRREPSKHYVYKIQTVWSDGAVCFVYRRYRKFFDLQCKLLHKFPEEANEADASKRIIPFLPGKIIFGSSHNRNVAFQRLPLIKDYCQALIQLPEKISRNPLVLNFFEPSSDDIKKLVQQGPEEQSHASSAESISWPVELEKHQVICDFKGETTGELSLTKGDIVGVMKKERNGWCFVSRRIRTSGFAPQQGWVPTSYLKPMEEQQVSVEQTAEADADADEEEYVAMDSFEARSAEELDVQKGSIVQIVSKHDNGWYWGKVGSRSGYVPAAYVRAIFHPLPIKTAPTVTNGVALRPAPPQREPATTARTSQYDKKPPRPPLPKAKPVVATQSSRLPAATAATTAVAGVSSGQLSSKPVVATQSSRLPAVTAATATAVTSATAATATVAGVSSGQSSRRMAMVKELAARFESPPQ